MDDVRLVSVYSARRLQLCGRHAAARAGLFAQATKKGKELLSELNNMERDEPFTLLDHIKNFSETLLG